MAQPSFWGHSEHHQPTVSRSWLIKHPPPHPVPPPRNSRPYDQGLWKPLVSLHKVGYCWRKNSCTSWYGKFSIIYRVLYIPGGWPWDFWTINSMKPSFHFKGYSRFSWPRGGVGGRLISHAINPWWDSGTATPECFGNMASSSRNLTT